MPYAVFLISLQSLLQAWKYNAYIHVSAIEISLNLYLETEQVDSDLYLDGAWFVS
jgi:hypothetical protein